MTKSLPELERDYWLDIQKVRDCPTCLFFDSKREGRMGFCTYPALLKINVVTKKCDSRKEKNK